MKVSSWNKPNQQLLVGSSQTLLQIADVLAASHCKRGICWFQDMVTASEKSRKLQWRTEKFPTTESQAFSSTELQLRPVNSVHWTHTVHKKHDFSLNFSDDFRNSKNSKRVWISDFEIRLQAAGSERNGKQLKALEFHGTPRTLWTFGIWRDSRLILEFPVNSILSSSTMHK